MIMQEWHAATTTRHSCTLTHQFLTDLQTFDYRSRVASRYSVRTSSVTGSGRGNPPKFADTLRAPVAEPPFLNPPL